MRLHALCVAIVMALGCHTSAAVDAGGTGGSTTSGAIVTTSSTATTTETGTGESSEATTEIAADSGHAILDEPDVGVRACDVWGQDCPTGFKCMPWSDDGGPGWTSLRCSPIADDPKRPGETCTVVGSGVSGVDDCELGAVC